jgi:putative DNA primase/helicase
MTIEKFLSLIEGARPLGNSWIAHCPAHDDNRPSLSIGRGRDGRLLIYCHGGCTIHEICTALDLHVGDLFHNRYRRVR